jgi:hypothetical protein
MNACTVVRAGVLFFVSNFPQLRLVKHFSLDVHMEAETGSSLFQIKAFVGGLESGLKVILGTKCTYAFFLDSTSWGRASIHFAKYSLWLSLNLQGKCLVS